MHECLCLCQCPFCYSNTCAGMGSMMFAISSSTVCWARIPTGSQSSLPPLACLAQFETLNHTLQLSPPLLTAGRRFWCSIWHESLCWNPAWKDLCGRWARQASVFKCFETWGVDSPYNDMTSKKPFQWSFRRKLDVALRAIVSCNSKHSRFKSPTNLNKQPENSKNHATGAFPFRLPTHATGSQKAACWWANILIQTCHYAAYVMSLTTLLLLHRYLFSWVSHLYIQPSMFCSLVSWHATFVSWPLESNTRTRVWSKRGL